jgi:hypothetical protein
MMWHSVGPLFLIVHSRATVVPFHAHTSFSVNTAASTSISGLFVQCEDVTNLFAIAPMNVIRSGASHFTVLSGEVSIMRSTYSRRTRFESLESRHMMAYLAGDYNLSGTVDNNDYNVWRAEYGNVFASQANGNGDEVVDAADYVVWRKNVGKALADVPPDAPRLVEATAQVMYGDQLVESAIAIQSRTNITGKRRKIISQGRPERRSKKPQQSASESGGTGVNTEEGQKEIDGNFVVPRGLPIVGVGDTGFEPVTSAVNSA